MGKQIERELVAHLTDRLQRPPALIQVIVGPRQVGKTTVAQSVAERWPGPKHYAAADVSPPPGPEWIDTHWQAARRSSESGPVLLVLDEVQKVRDWSELVKANWDDDRLRDRSICVILVGSSAMLLSRGATESLAGRFFLNRCPHWSFRECRQSFEWDLDQWIYFGGYPGAAPMIDRQEDWRAYITDSLIETAIARDVLASHTIAKPALLRNLFGVAARFPAQILSYNKMLGQLQDAGNTTTLAHYLRLLETAFLISGLECFSAGHARSRGSSPKLVFWNNALISAPCTRSFDHLRGRPDLWGRWVENAVGAHLLNHLQGLPYEITYWRYRKLEVDYVIRAGDAIWALEVKSGRPGKTSGLEGFRREHPHARSVIIGSGGWPLEEFFMEDPRVFFAP